MPTIDAYESSSVGIDSRAVRSVEVNGRGKISTANVYALA